MPTSQDVVQAMTAPGRLSRKVCTCMQAQCTCVCTCVHAHCSPALRPAALYWWLWRPTSLPVSTTKLQSPASWCHQGQRSREAELWGNGGEGPPLLPPHSCTAMKHVIFTQEQVGWRGKAPRRWSSWKEDLKKQWNKIPILRQVKKNLNITMFVCLFQPLPSPLVCIIHLHCALTRPL